MRILDRYARMAGMSEQAWKRHANPWSVWTRFAAIPLLILSIWSRVWIGWWALAPLALVIAWLWWNPHAFSPIDKPTAWSSKGIYGERLWLQRKSGMPVGFSVVQRFWSVGAVAGATLLIWGLVALEVWPTVFGATLIVYGQLWRIDRLGILYEQEGSPQLPDSLG
ncbi:DUF6653 family protein [Mycolicibacterium sp. YH-1]|uniref:DUF6653 family protein n=1 Tax=Mycolicibacterium sp. YH-1 TaxID=2908837 RepID=UPI001F4C3787|nr:DUF6653 family protein [Mycolicibacterium sp. YH-1]UNB55013.1 hypothetical protein L0M16_12260 [Mycolicibacterium sp. YH-1]